MSAVAVKVEVADEARLAAGAYRLARLPVLRLALDDEGLETAQRIGAALGGNSLPHKLRRRLGRCRLGDSRSQQKCSSKRHDVFHELLPLWTDLLSGAGSAGLYLEAA